MRNAVNRRGRNAWHARINVARGQSSAREVAENGVGRGEGTTRGIRWS